MYVISITLKGSDTQEMRPDVTQLYPQTIMPLRRIITVPEIVLDERRRYEDLKAKRRALFEEYLQNPTETKFAIQIKVIDDQVAASIERMGRSSVASNKLDSGSSRSGF
jgi:hypothetical protein